MYRVHSTYPNMQCHSLMKSHCLRPYLRVLLDACGGPGTGGRGLFIQAIHRQRTARASHQNHPAVSSCREGVAMVKLVNIK